MNEESEMTTLNIQHLTFNIQHLNGGTMRKLAIESVWLSDKRQEKIDTLLQIIWQRTGIRFENYSKYYFFITKMKRAK